MIILLHCLSITPTANEVFILLHCFNTLSARVFDWIPLGLANKNIECCARERERERERGELQGFSPSLDINI